MSLCLVPFLAIAAWILLMTLKVAHSTAKYAHWVAVVDFGSMCCFYATVLKQLWHVLSTSTNDMKTTLVIVHMAIATVNLMAGTSSLLRYIEWGALCEDVSG